MKHENHEWFEKIIKFFEQQDDNSKFNINELHFFQKYLYITKIITIVTFFTFPIYLWLYIKTSAISTPPYNHTI